MSDVRPFSGHRYARALEPRLVPPYDVINEADRVAFAREPENAVHLTLPPGESGARDYAGAARLLAAWMRDGVLVRDAEPAFYVVEERTTSGRVRRGFLAAVRLADYSERVIRPHERTMSGPKQDRLLLTREVRANLEPLFFLYEDRAQVLAGALEKALQNWQLGEARGPDGTELTLAALREPAAVEAIRAFLAERPLVIADGHHRYETMLRYRDEQRAAGAKPGDPAEFVFAYLVNIFDQGSRIEAIHRLVTGDARAHEPVLRELGFRLEPLPSGDHAAALEVLAAHAAAEHAFVLVAPGGACQLAVRPRSERLDVEVLHEDLLPRLGGTLAFDARPDRVLGALRDRQAALGILMNPLTPEAFLAKVDAGAVLPQKSTFFSPKIPAGLVFRVLS